MQIGVSDRMLRYYLAGERLVRGHVVPCLADYPTQFALEALAGKRCTAEAKQRTTEMAYTQIVRDT